MVARDPAATVRPRPESGLIGGRCQVLVDGLGQPVVIGVGDLTFFNVAGYRLGPALAVLTWDDS
ncbi:hypothetical protein [Nonomuraea zeae]|uniref:Uncharacterized protein n=1 Tax=Nonomuraea zeae TaxID=1642303 RepID=A0A5S4FV18_9ACTN|nr:hypothetical protein ETD85_46545 [Nonomuraea zeae]